MFEGVCNGVAVGVGVGVQHDKVAADRSVKAAVLPRIATRSRGLQSRGMRSKGGGDDDLDLERANQRENDGAGGDQCRLHRV